MIGKNGRSPASRVMDEAIKMAIAEESPYPEAAMFIDAGTPHTQREIAMAFDKGLAAVVVSEDGVTRTLWPGSASS